MINEFERVILTENLEGTTFVKGDVGTVIMIYPRNEAYELEFFALDGTTLGVETVPADKIMSVNGIRKVIHVDEISA